MKLLLINVKRVPVLCLISPPRQTLLISNSTRAQTLGANSDQNILVISEDEENKLISAVLNQQKLALILSKHNLQINYNPLAHPDNVRLSKLGTKPPEIIPGVERVPVFTSPNPDPTVFLSIGKLSATADDHEKRITGINSRLEDFVEFSDFNFLTLLLKGGLGGALALALFVITVTSIVEQSGISTNPLKAITEILGISGTQPVDHQPK